MLTALRDLVVARTLLREWTNRTIRARYQQSLLGWLWAIIQPAATSGVLALIFTAFVPLDTGRIAYLLFAYTAMAPWTFAQTSLSDMTASLVDNMNLINKIYFPREVLPLAAMLARLLDLGVAAAVLVVMMIYFRVPWFPSGWLCVPIILAIHVTLVTGLGLACSAVNVFLRDMQSLLVLLLQLWFYASPVMYPLTVVPPSWQHLYLLNPMAGILEAYRDVLLRGQFPGPYLLLAAVTSLAVFLVGYGLFKRLEFQFADVV